MSRILAIVGLAIAAGCSAGQGVQTFQGQRLERGGDQNSVVRTIDEPDLPTVLLNSARGEIAVGVFQAGTGKPYVTLRDANADGVFDLLTYSSLSRTGELRVEVEDFGMDGQPDFILNHAEGVASVFYRGTWREVLGLGTGESATIDIEGETLLLEDVLHELGRNAF